MSAECTVERVELAAAHRLFAGKLKGVAYQWAQRVLSATNPQREHGDSVAFLARQGDSTSGRIVAWTDDRKPDTGFFGFFESADSDAADALLAAAVDWCRSRGSTTMRGPIRFWPICAAGLPMPASETADEQLQRCLVNNGFVPLEDLVTWQFGDHPAPPPLVGLARATLTDPAITFAEFDPGRDDHWSLAEELYNACYPDGDLFYPLEQAELELMAGDLVADELSFVAFVRGTPAGLCLCLQNPDDAVALGNHVLPRAFGKLLKPNKERTFTLWLYGVAPAFRGAALGHLSTALYTRLLTRAEEAGFAWGIGGPTLDRAEKLASTLRSVGAHPHSRSRVYELSL